MNRYEGISFKCSCCSGEFYCLTEKFTPVPPMRGDYVALLPQYGPSGYNWYDFPHTEWTIGDNVACVQCGEPIRMEYVTSFVEEKIERLRQRAEESEIVQGHNEIQEETAPVVDVERAGTVAHTGIDSGVVDNGLYDEVDIEDGLLASVLKMTAAGETQVTIAETCGISVYRVRKLQNGDLK